MDRTLDATDLDVMQEWRWLGNHGDEDDSEPVWEVRKSLAFTLSSNSNNCI